MHYILSVVLVPVREPIIQGREKGLIRGLMDPGKGLEIPGSGVSRSPPPPFSFSRARARVILRRNRLYINKLKTANMGVQTPDMPPIRPSIDPLYQAVLPPYTPSTYPLCALLLASLNRRRARARTRTRSSNPTFGGFTFLSASNAVQIVRGGEDPCSPTFSLQGERERREGTHCTYYLLHGVHQQSRYIVLHGEYIPRREMVCMHPITCMIYLYDRGRGNDAHVRYHALGDGNSMYSLYIMQQQIMYLEYQQYPSST